MDTKKDIFANTYAKAFAESYPQLPAGKSADLIQKAMNVALTNIRAVLIDSPAFKLTCSKLGIRCSYKAIEEYLNGK